MWSQWQNSDGTQISEFLLPSLGYIVTLESSHYTTYTGKLSSFDIIIR